MKQTDIFSMFGIEDEVAIKKQKEEEERKKRLEEAQNRLQELKKANSEGDTSKSIPTAKKEIKDTFEVNFDTFIYHLGEQIAITDYFSTEEIENGIPKKAKNDEVTYEKINGEEVRKRLEKDFPDLIAAYTEMVYIKKKNMVMAIPKAKKKGLTDCRKELSSESSFSNLKIPFSILKDFITLAKEFSEQFGVELHGDIYVNLATGEFFLDIPKQVTSSILVEPIEEAYSIALRLMDVPFKKVMEIHSHHRMRAIPSSIDDDSERQTGMLYAIVGCIDNFFPEITLRIFEPTIQKHISLNPLTVFESPFMEPTNYDTSMVEVLRHV